jgi:hypothetical protein
MQLNLDHHLSSNTTAPDSLPNAIVDFTATGLQVGYCVSEYAQSDPSHCHARDNLTRKALAFMLADVTFYYCKQPVPLPSLLALSIKAAVLLISCVELNFSTQKIKYEMKNKTISPTMTNPVFVSFAGSYTLSGNSSHLLAFATTSPYLSTILPAGSSRTLFIPTLTLSSNILHNTSFTSTPISPNTRLSFTSGLHILYASVPAISYTAWVPCLTKSNTSCVEAACPLWPISATLACSAPVKTWQSIQPLRTLTLSSNKHLLSCYLFVPPFPALYVVLLSIYISHHSSFPPLPFHFFPITHHGTRSQQSHTLATVQLLRTTSWLVQPRNAIIMDSKCTSVLAPHSSITH